MIGDKKKINEQKGFTLIEVLVSVFIFSLIVGGIANALLTTISLQKTISAEQKMMAEVSYVLEYMSRSLRMAQKASNGDCLTEKNNYEAVSNGVKFLNYDGKCQEFFIDNTTKTIKQRISSDSKSINFSSSIALTSNNVQVEKLIFNNAGSSWSSPANNQSKITINLEIKPTSADYSRKFQTTVSQRRLNI